MSQLGRRYIRAIEDDDLETVQMAITNGITPEPYDAHVAVLNGHMGIARYLLSNHVPVLEETLNSVARAGNYDITKFLINQGGQSSKETILEAIRSLNPELVELILEEADIPIDVEIMQEAFIIGNVDIIETLFTFTHAEYVRTIALDKTVDLLVSTYMRGVSKLIF